MQCGFCGTEFEGRATQTFCSRKCGAMNRAALLRVPRLDEAREKPCEHCGEVFQLGAMHQWNIAKFRTRRYCSTRCSALATRPRGAAHPAWKPGLKQRSTRGPQQQWRNAVKKRDGYICQVCGQVGGKLHAHHIAEFAKYPARRWDMDNGITLCFTCHRNVHAGIVRVRVKNGVKTVKLCGNIRPADNTVPSSGGNPLEGVTTRGRSYGTWQGHCAECGAMFQRTWTRVRAKLPNVYCGCSCAAKARQRARYYGSNAPTSAPARKGKR